MTTEQFHALPQNVKAILVAKDVIAQLKINKYDAIPSRYVRFYYENGDVTDYSECDIKENFHKISHCEVCALGATLISATRLGNKLLFVDTYGLVHDENTKVSDLLKSIFSPKQLLLIETAFEGVGYDTSQIKSRYEKSDIIEQYGMRYASSYLDQNLDFDEAIACNTFYYNYPLPSDRLFAIMENIITNNGVFVP